MSTGSNRKNSKRHGESFSIETETRLQVHEENLKVFKSISNVNITVRSPSLWGETCIIT